eukprot:CAMPEP_0174265008 /NCGR_PEP_ID=MMETSP0439-20130205/24781_1 /TAXON_ID=0 /ORGANISM="Stereomyxa ramosa, Strain Chinc5" /LENGTH=238 /DNA_ID=CAMNT_0015351197 /DNA_START=52 /DNA_END=768 /DNA_ORIENTATION=+
MKRLGELLVLIATLVVVGGTGLGRARHREPASVFDYNAELCLMGTDINCNTGSLVLSIWEGHEITVPIPYAGDKNNHMRMTCDFKLNQVCQFNTSSQDCGVSNLIFDVQLMRENADDDELFQSRIVSLRTTSDTPTEAKEKPKGVLDLPNAGSQTSSGSSSSRVLIDLPLSEWDHHILQITIGDVLYGASNTQCYGCSLIDPVSLMFEQHCIGVASIAHPLLVNTGHEVEVEWSNSTA